MSCDRKRACLCRCTWLWQFELPTEAFLLLKSLLACAGPLTLFCRPFFSMSKPRIAIASHRVDVYLHFFGESRPFQSKRCKPTLFPLPIAPHIPDHRSTFRAASSTRNQPLADMSMSMPSSDGSNPDMEMVMMTPWLHFIGGDNLLFKSLHPSSHGAIAGACIVLGLLAIFERWLAGTRAVLETEWARRCAPCSLFCV